MLLRTNMANPFIRKALRKGVNIRADEEAVTLSDIYLTALYFFILTGIGVVVAIIEPFPLYVNEIKYASALVAGISLLLNYFFMSLTPVTGTLYSLTQGVVIGWVSMEASALYFGIVPIALLITLAIFLVVTLLYSLGLIKARKKVKGTFLSIVVGSVLVYGVIHLSSLFTNALTDISFGNGAWGVGFSALGVIIASASLVSDFNNVLVCVEERLPAKYRWITAFSLIVSILWLYLKVLELLSKIMPRSNNTDR